MPDSVAIHQPNYIPWIGYFHKIAHCDTFVFLDSVQYPRGQSFAARNRIKTPNGATYLTIPVSVPGGRDGKAPYTEVVFADDKWRSKHLRTLEQSYRRAPHFDEVFPLIASQIESAVSLVELNIALIDSICTYLGIDTPRVLLSETVGELRDKTNMIVDVCTALGATTYLSGAGGGRDYNDASLLAEHAIELRYDTFEHPTYPQLWGDFEPNLSIVDLLFNCGAESRSILSTSSARAQS